MKSLTFLNTKGGVGTTTLACNMASHLAERLQVRVLFVDIDPQCDATRLLLPEEQWERLYASRSGSQRRTVLKTLGPIRAGGSDIDREFATITSARFRVDVLPGHPSLATLEDLLSSSWAEFQTGELGGARRCAWVGRMVAAARYDLVIIDVGPGLGALNRSVLLGCDAFVTPVAADPFSLYGLRDIGEWIDRWNHEYMRGYDSLQRKVESPLNEYGLSPQAHPAFAGFTVQQHATTGVGAGYGSEGAYNRYRRLLVEQAASLDKFRRPSAGDPDLGNVPDMFSMLPLAQAAHCPIRGLTPDDGLRGAQVSQQPEYTRQLEAVAHRLAENLGLREHGRQR